MHPLSCAALCTLWIAPLAGCERATRPDFALTQVDGASPARGRHLMTQYQCASCHEIPQVPGHRNGTGPSLEAFGKRSYITGHIANEPATLQRWLVSPQSMVPGSPMPDLGVSKDDARHMAAYLLSLR